MSSMLEITHLAKTYGVGEKATHALGDVTLTVDGEVSNTATVTFQ